MRRRIVVVLVVCFTFEDLGEVTGQIVDVSHSYLEFVLQWRHKSPRR